MELTLRQRMHKFLSGRKGYTGLPDIYSAMEAVKETQKTAVRNMLSLGLGKQFARHPKYKGFYKAHG